MSLPYLYFCNVQTKWSMAVFSNIWHSPPGEIIWNRFWFQKSNTIYYSHLQTSCILSLGPSFIFAPWRLNLCALALLLCSSQMSEQQDPWVEVSWGHGIYLCSISMGITSLPLGVGLGCHLVSCTYALCVLSPLIWRLPGLCCEPVRLPESSKTLRAAAGHPTVWSSDQNYGRSW